MATKRNPNEWRVSSPKAGKARAVVRHWIVKPGGHSVGWFPSAAAAQAEADKRNSTALPVLIEE
jgi:hypothetical protein